ncbi:MAG TPA: MerR family transcriptional regulator [Phototrophicaceae bacterium]|jgi:DNA-binding transcriptional MerR regulator|nr:MerR family transcriptional regulator [Phototrophicaceae bacterium]
MMNHEQTYTIQEVSQASGLPGSTLRYYEEIGLLDPVDRAGNGHRRYTNTDLRRLDLIIKLRLTGMSIDRMRDLVALYRGGKPTAGLRREMMEAHRQMVQARVDELLDMLVFIDHKIDVYQKQEAEYEREREEQNYEVSVAG